MYEMFLGFIEQAKFWDIQGIDGVYKFLCWFYDLFFDKDGYFMVSDEVLDKVEFKVLYQAIQKVEQDIECFFFNICVSVFMIVINELCKMKCNKWDILEFLVVFMAFFVFFIIEDLWFKLGYEGSVYRDGWYLVFNLEYFKEDEVEYLIVINGKIWVIVFFFFDVFKEDFEVVVWELEYI